MKPFNVFPYDSKIDFMRLRVLSTVVATLIMLVAIGAMAVKGFNFALDFTGGVGIELRFDKPVEVEDVRANLAKAGFEGAQVQNFGTGNDVLIRLQEKVGGSNKPGSVAQDVKRQPRPPRTPRRCAAAPSSVPRSARSWRSTASGRWSSWSSAS